MKQRELDKRVKKKSFFILNLLLTFVVFEILTTIQIIILGKYIDYINISNKYKIMILTYWLIVAVCSLVTNVIYNLRKKIEPDSKNPTYLKTMLGIGYKFSTENAEK